MIIKDWILTLLASNPNLHVLLVTVGALRLVVKPLMTGLRQIAAATPNKTDDQLVDTVERSKAYTAMIFALDWLTSIKVN